MAKKAAAAGLKDPASAQFRNVNRVANGRVGAFVCGEVNGKNSLGAYTGFEPFIFNIQTGKLRPRLKISPDDEVVVRDAAQLVNSGFDEDFARGCGELGGRV